MFVGVKGMKKIILYSKNGKEQQNTVGYISCTYEPENKKRNKQK